MLGKGHFGTQPDRHFFDVFGFELNENGVRRNVEHLIYFSTVLLYWVVPSHPIHVMFSLQVAALMSGVGHIGFNEIVVKGKIALASDYCHYLHHRHFECNYGNTLFPADRWFGTFHDGSPEAQEKMVERIRAKRAANKELTLLERFTFS